MENVSVYTINTHCTCIHRLCENAEVDKLNNDSHRTMKVGNSVSMVWRQLSNPMFTLLVAARLEAAN